MNVCVSEYVVVQALSDLLDDVAYMQWTLSMPTTQPFPRASSRHPKSVPRPSTS